MKIYKNFPLEIQFSKPTVITIGTFDGVHITHQFIFQRMVKIAKEIDGESIVITFNNNPKNLLQSNDPIYLLSTVSEKTAEIAKFNIDHLIIIEDFQNFFNIEANDFIQKYLYDILNVHTILMGYNHKFGKNRIGDIDLMKQYAQKLNFKVEIIQEQIFEKNIISSTLIREALNNKEINQVNYLLGKPYTFSGIIVEGLKIGRTLGFPTANIAVQDQWKLIPPNGVYAVTLCLEDQKLLYGMMNIGVRPTFNGINRIIEVHIFDFDTEIYGQSMFIFLQKFIRNEIKFNGIENLKIQLNNDKLNIQQYFKNEFLLNQ